MILLSLLLLGCVGKPVMGTLPEGIYGSPDLGLRVDADGVATFERSCGRGDLGVVIVADGTIHADFEWVITGGTPDSSDAGTPATLDASVTTLRLWGTVQTDTGADDIDLTRGVEPTYYECP